MYPLAVMGLGPGEWILIILIILVAFGAGKLPQIGSGLGKAIKNFKHGIKGDDTENSKDDKSESNQK